jgi:hypothetical protein
MTVLEHLQGTGVVTVQEGEEIQAAYDIRITQDDPATPPVNGGKHISGQVWSTHDPYFVITHFRKVMTLRMEDGRKFRFFHRDDAGNIGLNKWIG